MLKTFLIGFIGNDAIISVINGKNAIKFNVAYNEVQKVGDQTIKKEPRWIRCTFWRETGESIDIAKSLKKGTQVFLEGVPKEGAYQKDGITIPVMNLSVYNLRLLSPAVNKISEESSNQNVNGDENRIGSESKNEEDDFYSNLLR